MNKQGWRTRGRALNYGAKMRRFGFTLIELLVVLGIGVIAVTMVSHVFYRATNHEGRRPLCAGNLRLMARAVRQYAQDHDGRFSTLLSSNLGSWSDSLQPRLKSWRVFQCPTTTLKASGTTDYYLNANLPQLKAVSQAPQWMILAGEGVDDSPPSYSIRELSNAWRFELGFPTRRHHDGANYAFVDGHVKWLKPLSVGYTKVEAQAFFTTR